MMGLTQLVKSIHASEYGCDVESSIVNVYLFTNEYVFSQTKQALFPSYWVTENVKAVYFPNTGHYIL